MPAEIHTEALTFLPEPVCVHDCMYTHIILIPEEDFCSVVAQRAGLLPEQPTASAALLCVLHDSQIACPSALKPCQSCSTQVCHSLNYFPVTGFNICENKSLRASARESEPTQTTVHAESCPYTCIVAPISSHASLPGTSLWLACALPLRQTVLPEMNAEFQQVKIFHCCLSASSSEKKVLQSSTRQCGTISVTSFINGFTLQSEVRKWEGFK